MKLRSRTPTPRAIALRDKVIALMRNEMANMPADEILAVMSYTVGQFVALQDQRTMTREMVWEIVGKNIELGNAQAIEEIFKGAMPT